MAFLDLHDTLGWREVSVRADGNVRPGQDLRRGVCAQTARVQWQRDYLGVHWCHPVEFSDNLRVMKRWRSAPYVPPKIASMSEYNLWFPRSSLPTVTLGRCVLGLMQRCEMSGTCFCTAKCPGVGAAGLAWVSWVVCRGNLGKTVLGKEVLPSPRLCLC